jgi:hypothetical protein
MASYWQIVTLTGWNGDLVAPLPQGAFSTAARMALMVSGQSMLGVPLGDGFAVGRVGGGLLGVGV